MKTEAYIYNKAFYEAFLTRDNPDVRNLMKDLIL